MVQKKFSDGSDTNFREKIELGIKIHTIRESSHIREGMMLSFRQWSGLPYRSKQEEFYYPHKCISTQKIEIIYEKPEIATLQFLKDISIIVDRRTLSANEMELIAKNDGFNDLAHFKTWFKNDFAGEIKHWTNFKY